MKCPHADLIVEYAKDAQEYPEPWILWEYKDEGDEGWDCLTHHPRWYDSFIYRRKLKTVNFMGVEIIDDVITSWDEVMALPDMYGKFIVAYIEDLQHQEFTHEYHVDPAFNCGEPYPLATNIIDRKILHRTKHGAIDYTRLRLNLHRIYDDEGKLLKTEEREDV